MRIFRLIFYCLTAIAGLCNTNGQREASGDQSSSLPGSLPSQTPGTENSSPRKERIKREDSQTVIRKCCPIDQILDNVHGCIPEENAKANFEKLSEEKIPYVVKKILSGKIQCPVSSREEYEVAAVQDEQTAFGFHGDLAWDEKQESVFQHIQSFTYECVDIKKKADTQWDLIAIRCSASHPSQTKPILFNNIRKCCGPDQVLDTVSGTCNKLDYRKTRGPWIRSGFVLSNYTGEPVRGTEKEWVVNYHQSDCPAENWNLIDKVVNLLTNETAISPNKTHQHYQCIDRDQFNQMYGYFCIRKSCPTATCVSKCCSSNQIYQKENSTCVNAATANDVWSWRRDEGIENIAFLDNILDQLKRTPDCKVTILRKDEYTLLSNGTLDHKGYGSQDNYCVDNYMDENGKARELVIGCLKEASSDCTDHRGIFPAINTFSGAISEVFLLLTFIVYICIPELRNLHGCIVLSNVSAIFLVTLYLIIVYNMDPQLVHGSTFCILTGYVGYFLTISMFAWMSIMCIDLCWTFLRARVPRKGSTTVKFAIYSVTAWGFGGLMTVSLILLQTKTDDQGGFPRPDVGLETCFVAFNAQGIYLHLPVFLMMSINGFLFLLTVITLIRSRTSTRMVRSSRIRTQTSAESRESPFSRINNDSTEQLLLFTKLFTVMGVLWITECIDYFVNSSTQDFDCLGYGDIIFKIFGCLNLLRGFLFFIIFVCKSSTLNKLGKLTICGIEMNFLSKRTNNQCDSVSCKGTVISINRLDSDSGLPMRPLNGRSNAVVCD